MLPKFWSERKPSISIRSAVCLICGLFNLSIADGLVYKPEAGTNESRFSGLFYRGGVAFGRASILMCARRVEDARPPIAAGKPGERRYRLIYFMDNQTVGAWSDGWR